MQVRMTADRSVLNAREGQILELPEALARSLIRTGYAVEYAIPEKRENAARRTGGKPWQ